MSNWFGTSPGEPAGGFAISNGGTDLLVAALCMAGTPLARTPQQVRLMVWLASHDQVLLGRGVVGFDLADLPWEPATFDADRRFLLAVVAAARTRRGWERLDYTPPPDLPEANLDRFAALIDALEPADVAWDEDRAPCLGWPEEIRRCAIHDAYEHAYGCVVCNDR